MIRPKQSLGQNFLRDENIARKMIAAFNPQRSETILEIGPGEGVLTKYLVSAGGRLVLVELDERIVRRLQAQYSDAGVEIRHEDFLTTDLARIRAGGPKLRLIGNIPYNITTPILFRVLDDREHVHDAMLMMQREVARRLVAQPRTKEYGILSVLCRLYADIRVLFDVSPGCFVPAPGVVSSVVHLMLHDRPRYALEDEQFFRQMVRAVFGKRRKTLRNSLQYFLESVPAVPARFRLSRRPEELSLGELVELANALHAARRVDSQRPGRDAPA